MSTGIDALTAAFVTRTLPREKRVALTAAAALIDSSMALAPALIGLQAANAKRGDQPGAGDEEVYVPRLIGLTEDAAKDALRGAKLKPKPQRRFNRARDRGLVYWQDPSPDTGVLAQSYVAFRVSMGPPPPGEEKPAEGFEEMRNEMAEIRREIAALRQAIPRPAPLAGKGAAEADGAEWQAGDEAASVATGGAYPAKSKKPGP